MIAILSAVPSRAQPGSMPAFASYPAEDRGLVVARLPQSSTGVPYYLYVPANPKPNARPLVAVHGISRNAADHAAAFAPMAESSGRIVVAPLFSTRRCRYYQRVHDGCLADAALLATLDDVAAETGVLVRRIDLFGFSGGSQFAHRFAMLHPDRVNRLALASAGWYTFPTRKDPYPYGMGGDSAEDAAIQSMMPRFLRIPTLVLVGERDTTRDQNLRRTRRIDRRQGMTRVERGARWVRAFRRTAARSGVAADVQFRPVPGCAHSFEDCVAKGGMAAQVLGWFEQAS